MSVRCVCASSRAFLVPRVSSSFSERSPSSPSLTALATLNAARVSSRAAVRAQTAATLAKLKSMWVSGEVGPDTPVWTEGMPERTRVRDVPSLLGCLPGASLASPRAALLSDDLRWEPGGHRHRAAAAAAAAGECPPALVLDLLRELRATQRVCAEQRATIDSLSTQRRMLMDDERRARRDEEDATRETALAKAESEARDLIRELRVLAVEARAERVKRVEDDGERRRRRPRDGVFLRDRDRRGGASRLASVDATVTARDGADADARLLAAPKTLREKKTVRDGAPSVSAVAAGSAEDDAAGSVGLVDELARGVSARVLKDAPPLRRVRAVVERNPNAGGIPRGDARRRHFAFELCGRRLWIAADGAGASLLVRAGGGSLDLEAWLRRNRFWERARFSAGGARDARRGTDRV